MQKIGVHLSKDEIPRSWYNMAADLERPVAPPLHPGTKKPIDPVDLARVFPENLIQQEMSTERWINIPEEVLERLLTFRPTPLIRAVALERYLQTPARIYYKNEGVSPTGSHKSNTAIPQAYYNREFGIKRLITETGAGQWGSALALGCSFFGLECKVYMVRVSYEQKPYRRVMMKTWGADCIPSPSPMTSFGKKILEEDPHTTGSLGIAIGEAIEDAVTSENSRYSLGSVLNHVLLHQTIIGLEAEKQMEALGEKPHIIAGCVGGGSNFAGLALPFIRRKQAGEEMDILCAESTACPSLTAGSYVYDFGDTAATTPLLAMYSLGYRFVPPATHAGGLRYHGMAPLVSHLQKEGLIRSQAIDQLTAYKAGLIWARTEGTIPAPETNHVLALAMEEARRAREEGKEKNILIAFSGHGLLDLQGYQDYLQESLTASSMEEEDIAKANAGLAENLRP